ncbi:primosomal protein N' [Alcanivorax profundi]|uniref:Replication restart protein PriA n=1 Tax=Alcanivorax profundi TaxID=2338368 RepID=A0A418XY71_9GAMM|nr:primosomal protein N' [Alcanivorax profundi]RJG17978.1 primosomal protein N' [Alcanivorax profundi]
MSTKPVLQIALPVPLPGCYDYLYSGSPAPAQGTRVQVPFGRRTLVGVVHGQTQSDYPKLKAVSAVLDDAPVFTAELYALCERAARYYHHPLGEVLNYALPALLRQGGDAQPSQEKRWRLTERGTHVSDEQVSRAPRQHQALQVLREHPKGLSSAMLNALDVASPALNALRDKGWAEHFVVENGPGISKEVLAEPPLAANGEQQQAIHAIQDAEGFTPFLLDGVTGSGKTEVYLQAMAPQLAAGKQVLVLVPEIGLTPQTVQRFRQRFAVPVTTLHSGLTDRERLDNWLAARDGKARIIIGTRSAIFTPLANPGLIIVDEAHDSSLKQQDGFRYHARDLATWRAQTLNIPVVLGSATPALETLQLARDQRFHWLKLSRRATEQQRPGIEILDATLAPPNQPLLPLSLQAIKQCVDNGNQALVFINRRGYAPMILCQDCGWQAECKRCDSFLTWHRAENNLRCHHCDSQQRVPSRCPSCGSSAIHEAGSGTEKLTELLEQSLPVPVIRIDRDATRRKGELDSKLKTIRQGDPAVLVGTQMLAKGHHFPKLALVVILDMDAGFLSADFRGPEQAAQLLLQVAGRSGREGQGRVLLQTRHPDHHLLQLAASGDYPALASALLEERRMAALPPFGHLALFRCEAMTLGKAMAFLQELAQQPVADGVNVLGPVPAPMEKRAGRYRAQLLLQASQRAPLHQTLERLLDAARQSPQSRQCRWHVDVDPIDML